MTLGEVFACAMQCHRSGRLIEAERLYRRILGVVPAHPATLGMLGMLAHQTGDSAAAVDLLKQAIGAAPDLAATHANLGIVLRALGRFDEAEACCRRALAINPDDPGVIYNLANVLRDRERPEEAEACYRRVLANRPPDANVHLNLGLALQDQGRFPEALAHIRQSLDLQPQGNPAAGWLGGMLLRLGDFAGGWPAFEGRPNNAAFRAAADCWANAPVWEGRPLPEGSLLLVAEGGFGDAIQFFRYLPLVRERCPRIIVHCRPELVRLFAAAPCSDGVIFNPSMVADVRGRALFMGLPWRMGTGLATIPARVPYLRAEPARVEAWGRALADGTGVRVGIVWETGDRQRSLPTALLEAFAAVPGISLISLQKGEEAERLCGLSSSARYGIRFPVIDEGPDAFVDTAAVMMHLDLVVTIDTAVAHLAGALGRPVWVMLPRAADWRWLVDHDRSPWYPTMRLFRQERCCDWAGVVARVAEALHGVGGDPGSHVGADGGSGRQCTLDGAPVRS